MAPKRRTFQRISGTRRYRKVFVIATEGAKTEQQYFSLFNNDKTSIQIKCLSNKKHKSSPKQVLSQMKKHLKDSELRKEDQAWLVVDKDDWDDADLNLLYQWSQQKEQYGLALSNPMFEYWLTLHFDDGNDISTSRDCKARIKQHIQEYDKNLNLRIFTPENIQAAIQRAKVKDRPPCQDWPRQTGTTVYRLITSILAS